MVQANATINLFVLQRRRASAENYSSSNSNSVFAIAIEMRTRGESFYYGLNSSRRLIVADYIHVILQSPRDTGD